MTTIIKLKSKFKTDNGLVFKDLYINVEHIIDFATNEETGDTILDLSDRSRVFIKETPEEIDNMIWLAEHPGCNL